MDAWAAGPGPCTDHGRTRALLEAAPGRIERLAAAERQREGQKEGGRGRKKTKNIPQSLGKVSPTRERPALEADDRAGKAVGLMVGGSA